jgi:ferric-dicitrate binding protein FerR (iron transport regulator)
VPAGERPGDIRLRVEPHGQEDDIVNPLSTEIADVRYATPIGGLHTITLADGTVMTLDAASAVRVSAPGSVRRVAIERGQAFSR